MLPHLIFVLKAAWATFRWGLNQELQLAEGPSSFGMFGVLTILIVLGQNWRSCCFYGFYAFYILIMYWFIHGFMDSYILQRQLAAASRRTFFPTAPGSSFRNMRGSGSCPCPWQNHEPSGNSLKWATKKFKTGTPYFPLYIQYWLFHRDPYFMVYEIIPT